MENIFDDFISLSGDRLYSEDFSLKGGIASVNQYPCLVLGNDKGKDIDSRVKNNFGMAKPEGYRKAIRLMNLAEKFNLPVICFIDTPGAFPGVDAEDRGQSEAIANSIQISLELQTPMQSFIVGEGGSGGAIALATANEVIMLEHAIYSVISPEGCASILWRSGDKAEQAASALRLTAQELMKLEIIDTIIDEPMGGAQREPGIIMENLAQAVDSALSELLLDCDSDLKAQVVEADTSSKSSGILDRIVETLSSPVPDDILSLIHI